MANTTFTAAAHTPMHVPLSVKVPQDLQVRLRTTIPHQHRSQFVAMAIEKALAETAKTQVAALLENPPLHEVKGQGNSLEVLQSLRQERSGYLVGRHQTLTQ